ncbi:MAG TPA: glycosyltransferase family 4 protein [Actinoplanes sp.]|nr:glycosyltransferase family 4 protein [Actinoplanes sp.]
MRITYIHQYFRTPAMSGGTRSYEFARRLVQRGHEVHVITGEPAPGWAGNKNRTTVESGIVIHWVAVACENRMSYPRRLMAFARFMRSAAVVALKLEHDLVFATSTPLTVAVPGALAARRRRVPLVLEVRDLWPELPIALGAIPSRVMRWAAWRLEAWAYRRSSRIVALSPGMAGSIKRRFPSRIVTTIPNCSDPSFFADAEHAGAALRSSLPWLQDRPLILYAGALGLANGVDYLVRTAAALAVMFGDARVVILGSGRMADGLREEASRLDILDRNLFMLDAVSKNQAKAFFGACDLVVSTLLRLPQLDTSSPNKVFDGFAAGRPVAVNYGGWIADLIAESGAGLVLPPDDTTSAAQAITDLLTNRAACSRARAAARGLARERFDRDRQFQRFERVLLEAARGAARQTRAERTRTGVETH